MEAVPASPIAVFKEIPSLWSTTRIEKEEEQGCDDEPAQFRRVCLKRPTTAPPASLDDINGMSTIAKPDDDPFNRTIISSQRKNGSRRKFPSITGWYCFYCSNDPLSLTTTPRYTHAREDMRIYNHGRCYFCFPFYSTEFLE